MTRLIIEKGYQRLVNADTAHSPVADQQPLTGRPVVWMFTGQGAQYYQMGRELYDHEPVFRQAMLELDDMVADYVGQSVVQALYHSDHRKSDPFEHIVLTNPALFMVQYALTRVLLARGVEPPTEVFGSSLGEFVAAAVAGCQPLPEMLFDLVKKARLFDAHCQGGAMLMVLDNPDDYDLTEPWLAGVEISGFNFDRCFTLSGGRTAILRVAKLLVQRNVSHQVLPMQIGFHSAQIDSVRDIVTKMFELRSFASPTLPFNGCTVLHANPVMSSQYWWQVMRGPIRFKQSLAALYARLPDAFFVDLGPAGNMATFARYNLPTVAHEQVIPILNPFGEDLAALQRAVNRLSS